MLSPLSSPNHQFRFYKIGTLTMLMKKFNILELGKARWRPKNPGIVGPRSKTCITLLKSMIAAVKTRRRSLQLDIQTPNQLSRCSCYVGRVRVL